MSNQSQKPKTFFSAVVGVASILLLFSAALIYVLGSLVARGYIDLSMAREISNTYWVLSMLFLAVFIRKNFRRFYGTLIRRWRLYTAGEIALVWYFGGLVFVGAFVLDVLLRQYEDAYVSAFDHSSMKPLLGAYAGTAWLVFYAYTVIVLVVAKRRGVACSNSSNDSES